jgi:hypothetical protein
MTLFVIEIWNGDHWVPIPETVTLEERVAYIKMGQRRLTYPHIKYRVVRYKRMERW